LATASRREKGGKAGVEGVRLSDDFNEGRDSTLKIGLMADFGAFEVGLGVSPPIRPPYGNSDGIVRREGLGCCTASPTPSPLGCSVCHDSTGDKLKVWIGGGELRSEIELPSIDDSVKWWPTD